MRTPHGTVAAALLLAIGAILGATAFAVIDQPAGPPATAPPEEASPSILNRSVLTQYILSVNLTNATADFGSPLEPEELLVLPSGAFVVAEPLRPVTAVVTMTHEDGDNATHRLASAEHTLLVIRHAGEANESRLLFIFHNESSAIAHLMPGPCLYEFEEDGSNVTAPSTFMPVDPRDSPTFSLKPRPEVDGAGPSCMGSVTIHPPQQRLVVRVGERAFASPDAGA